VKLISLKAQNSIQAKIIHLVKVYEIYRVLSRNHTKNSIKKGTFFPVTLYYIHVDESIFVFTSLASVCPKINLVSRICLCCIVYLYISFV